MLHITNGDSAAETLKQSGLQGITLAWRDILHEGPTPAGFSLEQMSELRARFIVSQGWGTYDDIRAAFHKRDAILATFHTHEEVILWFEHDLYDQLQLIQILDWFSQQNQPQTKLSLICINAFPGINNFSGLGQLNPEQMRSLFPMRRALTRDDLERGKAAWQAYCSPDPTAITTLVQQNTSTLPFLQAAFRRHLEQFPHSIDGLARSERQILEAIAEGNTTPSEVFQAQQTKEESPFMGDTPTWSCTAGMSTDPTPLLQLADDGLFTLPATLATQPPDASFLQQKIVLTEAGRTVLQGKADWIKLHRGIDRWLGGVHLQGSNAQWRWDKQQEKLVAQHL
ncbi:MAG: DUF1835 domain-containing protein [Ktedonobacteraceae bacterium]|nr:DUF1835 domain-containing protein [Ktedonobacteraceae bacterium]